MQGETLKAFRISEGYNQTELAQYLGIRNKYTISRWENNRKPIPKWVELRIQSELKK
jgi:transcriptional regulator with XRE-family HTH domain